jgi:hypothetical protein
MSGQKRTRVTVDDVPEDEGLENTSETEEEQLSATIYLLQKKSH